MTTQARSVVLATSVAACVVLAAVGSANPERTALSKQSSEIAQLDPVAADLVRKSRAAEARSDYLTALQLMQLAATYLQENDRWNFLLWSDLASLYCKQARGEKSQRRAAAGRAAGRAMLNEYKCAVDLWTNKQQCRLPWGRLERHPDSTSKYGPYDPGLVPNPALTPLCFRTLCGASLGAENFGQKREDELWDTFMEAEPPEGFVSEPVAGSKNVPRIEALCREPGARR